MMATGGFLTVFAGAMVGSWFGDLFDSMKNVPLLSFLYALKTHTMLFDPTKGKGPLIFFGISIVVGVLHIFTGMLLDAWQKFRDGDVLGALVEDIGWILVIGGFVGSIMVAPSLKNLGFFGLAMVFVLGCLRGKAWYQKLLGGFKELYGGIGFVGDIFSYVRLMALGMVTGGIAQSMNLLAKLVWVSNRGLLPALITGIFALLILVFGHLFSVAINTLGAFVHSLRLQYVEFFTKFYEGGGKLFKPLALKGVYVDVVEETTGEKKGYKGGKEV
jgi:V/A-type H+-transporting ATPase subunit I